MSIITLYHGTPNEFVTPQYGYGEDKHDYMRAACKVFSKAQLKRSSESYRRQSSRRMCRQR